MTTTMTMFLSISLALILGLLFTRVTGLFKLPDVTAYLVAGVLIGPFCLGRLGITGLGFNSHDMVESVSFISDLALGFIAFEIGNEFRMSQLRPTGRQAMIVGVLQALITAVIVDIVLIALSILFLGDTLSVSGAITLGAIATATAPAATLMVVKQYKAKGKVVDILLPVVALDDAVGLAVFAISFGVAKALAGGALDVISIVVNPLLEIICSLALGACVGFVLTQLEKLFHSNRNRIALIVGVVMVTVGLSMMEIEVGPATIGFSSLLVCMSLGTVFCNLCDRSADLMEKADKWTVPLMCLFFVISGAELDLSVFANLAIVGLGVAYIASRSFGKCFGAHVSCRLAKCDPIVTKYLGITLLPQAGVALGMCVTASTLPGDGPIIRNIILFSVLIYELVGPMMTKIALTKAGDIQEKAA